MGEANANVEIAHHLHGHAEEHGGTHNKRHERTIEILEAILLAFVAILTAWSGYQAARWDGESAKEYATSGRLRIQADQLYGRSGQTLAYNAGTFNAWLQAEASGDDKLAALMTHRFTPEYKTAFDAWLKLDPLHNPSAPAGPAQMPQYKDPLAEQSNELAKQSSEAFDTAAHDRENGEKYVRATVILATVLFLIALGQRFDVRGVRIGVLAVAGVLLAYGVVLLALLPRA
jgi:hypothetical protein